MQRFLIGIVMLASLTSSGVARTQHEVTPQEAPQSVPEPKPKHAMGKISGTVFCADTNLPARLAEVYLVPVTGTDGMRFMAQSDLDGRWAVRVPEGQYFVAAAMTGYVNLLAGLDAAKLKAQSQAGKSGNPVTEVLDVKAPVVTVSANHPTEFPVRLERGGEINGTVLFDDGSPAVGLQVVDKSTSESAGVFDKTLPDISALIGNGLPQITDDHGRFRLVGIAPGEYLVSVLVPGMPSDSVSGNSQSQMFAPMVAGWAVFAGNTLRESKAKPIKIDSGDSSTDTEITIPLSALHTIHGHVLLKSNGEPPPLAKIQLLYADTKELARTAIAQDGEFEIRYVPEDHYTLRAVASPDSDDHSGVGVVEGFLWQPELAWSTKEIPKGMAEISLEVTADLDNVSIVVPDPPMNRRAVRDETKGGN